MLCEYCNCENNQHLYNCVKVNKVKIDNTSTAINSFSGDYRFLSNFYTYPVEFEGCVYLSTEHAYQSAKTLDPEERMKFQYLLEEDISKLLFNGISHVNLTAGQAKRLGSKVKLRNDWESVKLGIMEELLRQKFNTTSPLREKLNATAGLYLQESNWWHDRVYGVCVCTDCNGKGENHLGKMLMKIRDEK